MRRIFWDTMLFAYWLEGNPRQRARVQHIYHTMLAQGDELCASLFVMSEVLVGPVKLGNAKGISIVEDFFSSPEVTLLPYTLESARLFAELLQLRQSRAQPGAARLAALRRILSSLSRPHCDGEKSQRP